MIKKFDPFYTPSSIAVDLVQNCQIKDPKYIADFAVGLGSLLSAAAVKYPFATLIFNDISLDCIDYHKYNSAKNIIFNIDFLDIVSVKEYLLYCSKNYYFDIILLNPPFTQRGASYANAYYDNKVIRCSTAFAFIINSLNFLRDDGELLAIIPSSCLTSDKDEVARNFIRSFCTILLIGKLPNKTFSGCTVNTVCVRILFNPLSQDKYEDNSGSLPNVKSDTYGFVNIFRGKMPMNKLEYFKSNTGFELIHTTNLKNGHVIPSNDIVDKPSSTIIGPCVLIPRIGKPTKDKIVIYNCLTPIVLSDCLIAIIPESSFSAIKIKDLILDNWVSFESKYSGSCAQYITLRRICNFINQLNLNSKIIDSNLLSVLDSKNS